MKPYKVVICALNSKYVHTALAPRCLLAGIERDCDPASVECKIVEGTVNELPNDVLARIERETPALLGLSCYIWNVTEMLSLANDYKSKHPNTRILLGGPEVSYRAEEFLRDHAEIDFILSGEGEETLPLLLRALTESAPLSTVPSLSYRNADGRIVCGEPYVGDGDPPDPYAGSDLSSLSGRIAYIESSRGCPYRCTFCLSGRLSAVRYFDMERVKADMLHLAENNVRVIKFVDRTFNADRDYAHALWRWIAESYGDTIPQGTRFHFEIAGERLDEASFSILSRMPIGAVQLEVGLQSFHSETLRAIRRNPDTERLIANIQRLTALKNIHTHIDLIAGLPKEDYETFVRGFDRAYRLGANMLQMGFLKLLPGAPMTEDGKDKYECKYSKTPPYEVMETASITAEELDKLRLAADTLDRLGNSGRFRRTVRYLTESCGVSPYALFYGFGQYTRQNSVSVALDAYTNAFAAYAITLPNVDQSRLLDCMVCDRLATNSSGVIPGSIRNFDKRLKRIRTILSASPSTAETKGVRRTLAALRGRDAVVWADYKNPDPITGEYTLFERPIRSVLISDGAEP